MAFNLQEMLRDACEESGGLASFRNDYSGRGMYGRQCVGIAGRRDDLTRILASAIKSMTAVVTGIARDGDDDRLADIEDEFDECLYSLLNSSGDDIGLDVIFYWPGLEPLDD